MKDLMLYLNEFEKIGKIRDVANPIGDYKESNKTQKPVEKIFNLAKDSEQKEEFYLTIMNTSTSPSAIITCCAHMLRLNVYPDLARKKLEEISKENSIFGFEAKMFLQEWDKGNIKPLE